MTKLTSIKAEILLVYLAVTQRPHSRELLADFLWDDRSTERAMSNLRVVLSSLRKHLSPFVIITREGVAFNRESDYWLDSEEVATTVDRVRQQYSLNDSFPPEAVAELEEALALADGEFLAGVYVPESRAFEEWALFQREYLRRLVSEARSDLVTHYIAVGEYRLALSHASRLLEADPLSEAAQRRMMLLLARVGQRGAALQQYQQCVQLFEEELGVEPTEQTMELFQRIRAATGLGTHNLPLTTTPFVGREKERIELQTLLARPTHRLLTLLGPGGVGKTRLAIQSASDVIARYPGIFLDGIRWVSLAPVPSAEMLFATIAEALSLTLRPGASSRQELLDYLRDREMLLILDNMEHLLRDGVTRAWIAELLQQAPGMKLLVTSRERLRLQDEWLFDVTGLSYPAVGLTGAGVEAYDAVGLFMQGAQRVRRDFVPTTEEFEAIVEVCQLVEGTPLALELAAAWARQLSCEEIVSEIRRSLDFLESHLYDTPDRHRSLRALFLHSWNLLSGDERRAARACALFRDPFSGEAAGQVTAGKHRLLNGLVDKSILTHNQEGRYDFHPLLRDFALERLQEWPEEAEAVRARYTLYYAGFLEQQSEPLRGPSQHRVLDAMAGEVNNLFAAWAWMVERGEWEHLDRALHSLYHFYEKRGHFVEGEQAIAFVAERLAEDVSRRGPSRGRQRLQGRIWLRQGRLSIYLGHHEQATTLLLKSLSALAAAAEVKEQISALYYLGVSAFTKGDYDETWQRAEQCVQCCEQSDDPVLMAAPLNLKGLIHQRRGAYSEAEQHFQGALRLHEASGDIFQVATLWNNLGNIAQALAAYGSAKERYQRAYDYFREIDFPLGMAATLSNIGYVAWKQGAYQESRRLHLESISIKRNLNNKASLASSLANLGEVTCSLGHYSESRHSFREALFLVRDLQVRPLVLDILVGVAVLLGELDLRQQGGALLRLIQRHPFTTAEARDRAAGLLRAGKWPGAEESVPLPSPDPAKWLDAVVMEVEALLVAPTMTKMVCLPMY